MSLGLLAKDSIGDLEAFAARAEAASSDVDHSKRFRKRIDRDTATSPEDSEIATANPQQAQEEDTPPSSVVPSIQLENQFAKPGLSNSVDLSSSSQRQHPNYYYGFETYSKDYYYHDSYAPMFIGEKQEQKSFWDCIFPCLKPQYSESDANRSVSLKESDSYSSNDNATGSASSLQDDAVRNSASRDDDEVSTNSDMLGERLSEKERQAVLARLGLAQPDAAENGNGMIAVEEVKMSDGGPSTSFSKSPLTQKGLLNGIPAYDASPLLSQDADPLLLRTKPLKGILKRRSMFGKDTGGNGQTQQQGSSGDSSQPLKRRSLFPSYETTKPRSNVNNHVSFAPMARVVTVKSKNEMAPEEKADIWFQKSDYEDFRKTGRIITKAMLEGGSEIWLTSSLRSTEKSHHGSKNVGAGGAVTAQDANKENPGKSSAPGDKWWHKFGHSRRGLEHIVSFDEGRQRQSNVRNAIHAVLEEQARQQRYRRVDPEKLRTVSLNHTNWARDLALAAGASDADAVRCSFAEDRKSREFYLLKMARTDPTVSASRIPEFMQPALRVVSSPGRPVAAMKAQRLDANTAAQLRFRQEQQAQDAAVESYAEAESAEPIRDPDPDEKKTESMAQRAKGFISEGSGKVDMSAVLSGLGAVAQKEPTAVVT